MPYNLFIGRWMPFHEGHKYIIDSFLNNGKKVCIAVRRTEVSEKNPFSTELRKKLIREIYAGNKNVEVIDIPDIEQVVIGRGVGYSLVEAPENIQRISGTKIRRNKTLKFNDGEGLCIWLTGLSGAGKTTIANELSKLLSSRFQVEILDGDNFRKIYTPDLKFTSEDRFANLRKAMTVAKQLVDYGLIVICAFIAPYNEIREEIKEYIGEDKYLEVFINCPLEVCEERDTKGLYKKARKGEIKNFTGIDSVYEVPENPNVAVETDIHGVRVCSKIIFNEFIRRHGGLYGQRNEF
jgi:adenylyl-sulfate kinase